MGTSGQLLLRNLKKAFSQALQEAMVPPKFVKYCEIILTTATLDVSTSLRD